MEYMERFTFLIFLLVIAFFDIKSKSIPRVIVILEAVITSIFWIIGTGMDSVDRIMGILIGVLLVVVSKLTKESIGYGDSITFCISGSVLGGVLNLKLLFYSAVFCSIYSLSMLLVKRIGRKDSIAFTPFIVFTYIGGFFL